MHACMHGWIDGWMDGCVKIQVYIQYSDTSGVQHMYTMHPAGPLGQVPVRQFAQRAKVLSDNTITACTS